MYKLTIFCLKETGLYAGLLAAAACTTIRRDRRVNILYQGEEQIERERGRGREGEKDRE